MSTTNSFSTSRIFAAWFVHFYTALGLPLLFLASMELLENYGSPDKDASMFFFWIWVAVFVDSTDGFMARAVDVKTVLPDFSGRRLDDLVDFISFAFLPGVAFAVYDLFPAGWETFAILPIMASGYGFCQEKAKTEDAFVGFPSYWNIALLYLYVFQTDPWFNLICIGILCVMVFIPIHYLYPTRTKMLRPLTLFLGTLWGLSITAISLRPNASWTLGVTWASLSFPVYYIVLSIVHHIKIHRKE